jgi:6-phosphogluconate dehydrogenase
MKLGMIGLGRMGANMTRRLLDDGHECVVYDIQEAAVQELERQGATGARSLDDLVAELDPPRAVWIMVPAALTAQTVFDIAERLQPGDIVVDGGNSYYKDDIEHAALLAEDGIHFVDVGTSGGVWGRERGYCLMIGGAAEAVAPLQPIFASLSPGLQAASRSEGRKGPPATEEQGYLHCGPSGAGHFVKMVHNGIEYALMAAYAEGLNVLANADIGARPRDDDAETAPLAHPEHYQFDIDTAAVAELWRRGSVIGSWLLDLTAAALTRDPRLEEFGGRVSDSGEGRWTILAAVEAGVPAHVLSAALYERFSSRGNADFAAKILSAMRKQFGGHEERSS